MGGRAAAAAAGAGSSPVPSETAGAGAAAADVCSGKRNPHPGQCSRVPSTQAGGTGQAPAAEEEGTLEVTPRGRTRPVRRPRGAERGQRLEPFLPVRRPSTAHPPTGEALQGQQRKDSTGGGGLGQMEGVPVNSTIPGLL